jgi:hypothetical protein
LIRQGRVMHMRRRFGQVNAADVPKKPVVPQGAPPREKGSARHAVLLAVHQSGWQFTREFFADKSFLHTDLLTSDRLDMHTNSDSGCQRQKTAIHKFWFIAHAASQLCTKAAKVYKT